MTIEKIETKFIIDDGFPSPKIISNSNNLYLNFLNLFVILLLLLL